jgi:hypothetical protein
MVVDERRLSGQSRVADLLCETDDGRLLHDNPSAGELA